MPNAKKKSGDVVGVKSVLAWRLPTKRARPSTENPPEGALDESDRELVLVVAGVMEKHRSGDFAEDVFTLPAKARHQLLEIIHRLLNVEDPLETSRSTQAEWFAYQDARFEVANQLHRWAHKWSARRSLVDAFLLDHETWKAVHVAPPMPASLVPASEVG